MKKTFTTALLLALSLTAVSCYDFNRQQNQLDAESNGKAILLEAESSKKAMIEESKAKAEGARLAAEARLKVAELDAQSVIKKAEAEAFSIQKIGAAIQVNPEYLKYLQVQAIKGSKGDKFFIATEANVPLLIK